MDTDVKCFRDQFVLKFLDQYKMNTKGDINSSNIEFTANVRIKESSYFKDDKIAFYNYLFFVPIVSTEDDIIKRCVLNLYKDGFVNKIPVFDTSILNRCKTMISIDLSKVELVKVIDKFEKERDENKENVTLDTIKIAIINNFINVLKTINENKGNDYNLNNTTIFIEFKNSVYNMHGIELVNSWKSYSNPVLASYQVGEFLKGEDIKLNFSEKGTGIYSANLAHEFFTTAGYLFRPIIGSFARIDKFGFTASYMGSIFTNDDFENYTKLRILLEINLKPKSGKDFFNNLEDFENFNHFIDVCKNPNPTDITNVSITQTLSLANINITIEGSEANSVNREKIAKDILKTLVLNNNPNFNFTDDKLFDDYVNDHFVTNGYSELRDQIKYTIKSLDTKEYNDVDFNVKGW